jgi:carboxyl-terminal processing protease
MRLTAFLPRLALALAVVSVPVAEAAPPDPGQICISVGKLLEQGHFLRRKLDDNVSRAVLDNYLTALDYNRLFFTEADVAHFRAKYGESLDDDILLGNAAPAFEIFDLFAQRVEARVEKIRADLKLPYRFDSQRSIAINRKNAPWPASPEEADRLWRDRIEGELLQEKLGAESDAAKSEGKSEGKPDGKSEAKPEGKPEAKPSPKPETKVQKESPEQLVAKRYDQLLKNLKEQTQEDTLKVFLNALAQTYDPHSEYLSRSDLENFQINMGLKLFGIGARLQSDDGYVKIVDLIPGGPAAKDGRLKVGDRITAVAQGDGAFEDVVGVKLDKVVEKIRGKEGTRVRLTVIPIKTTDPSQRDLVELVRAEVQLKEQHAQAELIEIDRGPAPALRLGSIVLPSFYLEMSDRPGKDPASTSADVRRLLERLRREQAAGVVIDLRRNGGGSLEEAIKLTGLFIRKGPVVQAKNSQGAVNVSRDENGEVAWAGPVVILTNRLSASASEIFAAALQDYGRAVVVGDSNTFGKGTVQTMLEIGRYIPFLGGDGSEAGALKLTIQKFYRIAGGSTQLRGVIPDIKLPSPYDNPELGESSLRDPMAYDEVNPARFDPAASALFLDELRKRSAGRVAGDPEFAYISDDIRRFREKLDRNEISLNESVRRTELAADKKRQEQREKERAARKPPERRVFSINLDNVDDPKLHPASNAGRSGLASDPEKAAADDGEEGEKADAPDPVRDEALRILADLVELERSRKTASAK